MSAPQLSVVIPVYNEGAALPALFARLYPALDALGLRYEVLFVDDGSRDRSVALLREQFAQRPEVTRVVLLRSNVGQHMAILAAFERCRGDRVVTLDADLQNPPEEIGRLLAKMDEGHDYVGGVRQARQDPLFRRSASRALNWLRERTTRIKMTDQGCMLRAYDRTIVDAINECREVSTFVPALAYSFARAPAEVQVAHEVRSAGTSKYSLYRLLRLNFDLMTGFSLVPLQLFSLTGMLVAAASVLLYLLVIARRLFAPETYDIGDLVWDRDLLEFFLLGMVLFGLGLVGEYVGRIYLQVRHRPRYVIDAVLERAADAEPR
ncbi:MAG: UDP-4-amino-4-deoxy-L-arabinose-oxoglutarate aminotransferase [Betaproteobacteria bacterium SG8_39]|jgi:undecaprenyl-phosphate 4-deoxy-4-formamido-L-arabinose transferase|nr:MAG: UDP-4-amino-4-deoxy-L-arabinose-oxoglutarate aminotransferase [Betaproteobacteria bacterium SG8_39]